MLSHLSARQDLLLVALLVLTVAMMILPVPTLLADVLIALNIGLSMVLMMVAVYIRAPVEFSTLPAVILITTAFRLSLSITTSRMVLVQADAGDIIRTFGDFVIAGNVVVGLVVYLIITIVQFVVITKGSERVAEVAARFSLDALPGRQISIDTDLKNGDIAPDEARRRRGLLQKESQLYGAMDGAMKFVKGDAIASLIIIIVNLLGGIAIGCLQHGMAFGEAVRTYSLLAVGDGLIAQIPALLISLTAGIVVTRVTSDAGGNLGHDIVAQLASEPRTLQVAAAVLGALAFVPGFPAAVFLCFAAILAGVAWLLSSRRRRDAASAFHAEASAADARPVSVAVTVHLGEDLSDLRPAVERRLETAREALAARLGIPVPPLRLARAASSDPLAGQMFCVDVDGVPALGGELDAASMFVEEVPDALAELGVACRRAPGPFGPVSLVVDARDAGTVSEAGLLMIGAADLACRNAERALLSHAGRLVGIQETQQLLRGAEAQFPELVREATRACPLPRMSDVLRLLVDEQVGVGNVRQVLEAVAEWAPREATTGALVEHVRAALRRQVCHRWSSGKVLAAVGLEAALEEALRPLLRATPQGVQLAPERAVAERLAESVRSQLAPCLGRDRPAVVLAAGDLRRPLRGLLRLHEVEAAVLSYAEVAPEFSIQLLGTLRASCLGAPHRASPGQANVQAIAA